MTMPRAPEWFRERLPRQLMCAVALSSLAVLLRWGLSTWLGEHHEFLPGYLAVAAATWLATWRAGLLAGAISLAALNSTLFESPAELNSDVAKAATIFAFIVVTGMLTYLTHHCYVRVHSLSEEVERLDTADHKKSEFLALIAHELRNPLSAMEIAGGSIKSGRLEGAALQFAWDRIERQSGQMKRLVSDLLDIARIEQGKINLQRAITGVSTLVERAVLDAAVHTGARAQQVVVESDEDLGEIDVDPLRMGQVLVNLLHNASKFSPDGSVITVSVRQASPNVVISIQDDGVGIAASHLSTIFDSFVQVEPASGRSQGLGLGLALCKSLVEMHGGTISAHSEGTGHGSQFIVTLPLAAKPAERPEVVLQGPAESLASAVPHAPGEAAPSDTDLPLDGAVVAQLPQRVAPLRVLVVDDNADAAESLALILNMEGHQSSTARDGRSALAQADREQPDFIFLDIGLPDMSGHEVAKRLRQNVVGKQPVLVALTGWGGTDDILRCQQSGFDGHLTKPVSMEQIEQALWLQQRPVATAPRPDFAIN